MHFKCDTLGPTLGLDPNRYFLVWHPGHHKEGKELLFILIIHVNFQIIA